MTILILPNVDSLVFSHKFCDSSTSEKIFLEYKGQCSKTLVENKWGKMGAIRVSFPCGFMGCNIIIILSKTTKTQIEITTD